MVRFPSRAVIVRAGTGIKYVGTILLSAVARMNWGWIAYEVVERYRIVPVNAHGSR